MPILLSKFVGRSQRAADQKAFDRVDRAFASASKASGTVAASKPTARKSTGTVTPSKSKAR